MQIDDSERARRALTVIAQTFPACTAEQIEGFLGELRARGMRIGVEPPMVLSECTICGTQRSVEPMQLGWLLYCDICGHQLAESGNAWTRCRADRADLREHVPFSQVTGTLQRTPLAVTIGLDGGPDRPQPGGKRPLYISARGDDIVALAVENTGPMPVPAGYLSCRNLERDILGPRPLLGTGERHAFHIAPPEVATAICVDFHPPRGALKNVANIRLVPLGNVRWRVLEAEPSGPVSLTDSPRVCPRSRQFAVEVRFTHALSVAGASGHLRLPSHTFSLRCRPSSAAGVHEWAATLDVVVRHQSEFEVRLSYPELVGELRLRGTLVPETDVARPRIVPERLPATSLAPPAQPGRTGGATVGWGVPLVIDAGASGIVAGCADGQQDVRLRPVTRVTSLVDAAAALQIRPNTANAMDEPTVGDTQSVLAAGTLDLLEHSSLSSVEVGWRPLGAPGGVALDTFAAIARGVLRQASDRRGGRPVQLALLFPPTMSGYRLDAVREVLGRVAHDVRVYTDIDRSSALVVQHLFGASAPLDALHGEAEVMVFDVNAEQTTVSVHRVSAQATPRGEAGDGKPAFSIQTRAAAAVKAGYLDVIDALGRAVLEPLLHNEPVDDDAWGSVETITDDPVWLFSPERREAWLERTSMLVSAETVADRPAAEPDPADPPRRPSSPVRRTILRLFTASLLIRLGDGERADLADVEHAEALARHLLTEEDFAPAEVSPSQLLERCSVNRKVVRQALRTLAERLVEPARGLVDGFLRSAPGRPRRAVLVHGPTLLCDGMRRVIGGWCASAPHGGAVEVVAMPSEEACALRGGMAYYESIRLGMLDVTLRVPPPVDRFPFAIESLTPIRRTLIPTDTPLPLAVGYVAISHPAIILGLRCWFDDATAGDRMAVSLDALPYRDGATFDDLRGGDRSVSTTCALKVRARSTPEADDLIVECEVVRIEGGSLTQIEGVLQAARALFDEGEAHRPDAVHLPRGMTEEVLTLRPVQLLRRPLDLAAPVTLEAATRGSDRG